MKYCHRITLINIMIHNFPDDEDTPNVIFNNNSYFNSISANHCHVLISRKHNFFEF